MAITSPKCSKESKAGLRTRGWIARPVLGSEYTDDLSLEDVYVGLVKQKRDISTAIRAISSILPGFHHLKRCSSNKLLLAPLRSSASTNGPDLTAARLRTMLSEKGFDLSLLEDDFQVSKVPIRAARTRTQATRASKIWPLNFHPDPNVERLIDGSVFTERQLDLIERYMNVAIEAARSEAVGDANCNGSAVIVDPEDGRVLAIAASRIDQHPMWHAAMLAVDLVAKLQGGGAWKLNDDESLNSCPVDSGTGAEAQDFETKMGRIKRKYVEEAPLCYPSSLSSLRLPEEETLKSNVVRRGRRNNSPAKTSESSNSETLNTNKCGPYLCTGYWTFLVREPCPLCAMALLHSRVSRIFYGVSNQSTGVLGSKTILHAVPGLNHRYQVWSGILEQECRRVLQEVERRHTDWPDEDTTIH